MFSTMTSIIPSEKKNNNINLTDDFLLQMKNEAKRCTVEHQIGQQRENETIKNEINKKEDQEKGYSAPYNSATSLKEKPRFIYPTKNVGEYFSLKTEKLNTLIRFLQSILDTSSNVHNSHRTIYFTEECMYIVSNINREKECRYHMLKFVKGFFRHYYCKSPGLSITIDLNNFIDILTTIQSNYNGKCVEIADMPSGNILVKGILDNTGQDLKLTQNFQAEVPLVVNMAAINNSTTPNNNISPNTNLNTSKKERIVTNQSYLRYPFRLMFKKSWLHDKFKKLRNQDEITIAFNMANKQISFQYILNGSKVSEDETLLDENILYNPFLVQNNKKNKDRILYMEGSVRSVPQIPSEFQTPISVHITNADFVYEGRFLPKSIWIPLKRMKLGTHIYLYLAPGQPLLVQYIIEQDNHDSQIMSTYNTWIGEINRGLNPHIQLPSGGIPEMAEKMINIIQTEKINTDNEEPILLSNKLVSRVIKETTTIKQSK